MKNSTGLKPNLYSFKFHSLRNISCPEDTQNDRKIYSGQAPVSSILGLPTNDNVRDYLAEAEGKQRKTSNSVHKAIRETLTERPEIFSILNGGIVIVAQDVEVDEKEKEIKLFKPSIINGSQTQGVLNYLAKIGRLPDPEVHIKFEIIVTADQDLIAEISIARNFQNDVMAISIAGRRKQFDELESSFRKTFPHLRLRKSETQLPSDEVIDTEKLLQVIAALVPAELFQRGSDDYPNKVYTYSMKARCLKEFQEIYTNVNDPKEHDKYKDLYQFYIDICSTAYILYSKWKSHPGFAKTGIKNGVIRDEKYHIIEVADGIIFPIISSLSVFARKNKNNVWQIDLPTLLDERELIQAAKTALMDMAAHNPQTMGKTKACYSHLLQITSIYRKFMNQN
jgi:hypothetical protein